MEKKYNLALTPISKSAEVIELANKFSAIADKYLLHEKSLPHVTLYPFQMEDQEIEQFWMDVCKVWKAKTIDLEFKQFSCISFDNHTFWVSLLPNHCDTLHEMHATIAHILRLPVKKSFDPHMTLINSKNINYKQEVALIADSYAPIVDKFILSLGESDTIGQLTEIVYHYDVKRV